MVSLGVSWNRVSESGSRDTCGGREADFEGRPEWSNLNTFKLIRKGPH